MCFVYFLFVFVLILLVGGHKLPPCQLYQDTDGYWVKTTEITKSNASFEHFERHVFGGGFGEALDFSEVWIPRTCSYHRFTNHTIHQCSKNLLQRHKLNKDMLRIVFVGDSALRGIICGIGRILSESEVFGPNINPVCGGGTFGNPVTTSKFGQTVDINYGPYLQISFTYVKDFETRHLDWIVENNIVIGKPYALVFNTAAWDFDAYARNHSNSMPPERCDLDVLKTIEAKRTSPFVNFTMHELARFGKETNCRTIYRNSHYNIRFGALCADEKFEKMIEGTGWEIWDNRNISKDVWMNQTWDGFHFDRHKIHTPQHHAQHRQSFIDDNRTMPGSLEMQLAQSLLQSICHEFLIDHYQYHHGNHTAGHSGSVSYSHSSNSDTNSSSSNSSSSGGRNRHQKKRNRKLLRF